MNKRIFTTKIAGAFGWKFQNIPKHYKEFERTDERISQLQSDINIGFEKDQRELLLKHLEGLTREKVTVDLRIPLNETPIQSPHHLDNENEIIEFEKISYTEIIISRIDFGRQIDIENSVIKLSLDRNALNELFTKLYINMEIYATYEDNIIMIENKQQEEIRLVIWGVINGKPIHY